MFIKFLDLYKFIKNHGFDTNSIDLNKLNLQFSKDFFDIIDQSGADEGGVSDFELSFPLIAMGLATDTALVQKVMKLMAPKKFSQI